MSNRTQCRMRSNYRARTPTGSASRRRSFKRVSPTLIRILTFPVPREDNIRVTFVYNEDAVNRSPTEIFITITNRAAKEIATRMNLESNAFAPAVVPRKLPN